MSTAIYCRVSTDEQAREGYSLAAQERDCRALAEKNSWNIIEVYIDDGQSGRTERRPALQCLLADIQRLGIKRVLFYDLDRLARNLQLQLNLKAELDARGVALVSINDNIDTSTPEGLLHFQIKGSLAEWYSNQLAGKVRRGLSEKFDQGFHNGPVPLGYKRDGKNIVPSADAPTVRLIFELYATGNHSDSTIAKELNGRGLTLVHRGGARVPFQRDSVGNILANPTYIGMVRYKDGPPVRGAHEPLIELSIWQSCQAIRARRNRRANPPATGRVARTSQTLLTELIYCGVCGARMHTTASGNAKARPYYRCGQRRKFGREVCDCAAVASEKADQQVLDILKMLEIPPMLRDAVLEVARKRIEAPVSADIIDRAKLEKRLDRLKELFELGDITRQDYITKRNAIHQQMNRKQTTETAMALDTAKAIDMLSNLAVLLDSATVPQQRAILQQIFSRMWCENRRIIALKPTATYVFLAQLKSNVPEVGSSPVGVTIAISPIRTQVRHNRFGCDVLFIPSTNTHSFARLGKRLRSGCFVWVLRSATVSCTTKSLFGSASNTSRLATLPWFPPQIRPCLR